MTTGKHILFGWSTVAVLALGAVIGLPMLADATSSLKEEARWQSRAQAFSASAATPTNDIVSQSALSTELADVQLDTALANPWMRDASVTAAMTGQGKAMIERAKNQTRETQCLAEAMYYESRSETASGQKAVAEVILNRVDSKHFPNTICGVVYQGAERTTGCQFSFTCDGSNAILPRGKSWAQSQRVAKHMNIGASADQTRNATHYHTTNISPAWAPHLRQTRTIDTHVFYRFMPRSRPAPARTISVAP